MTEQNSNTTVCVVGLGKIGLPLAVHIAAGGSPVLGADISPRVVELVNSGVEPFPGESDLNLRLADVAAAGMLRATTDTAAAVAESRAVIVVVPVLVDAEARPDFGSIDAATAAIGAGLQPDTLVSYETTLPIHTTRRRFKPALEAASGLECGTGFFLCHSPERVLTGRVFEDLARYPKLVGATDSASAERAVAFYEQVLTFDQRPDLARSNGVWDLGSAEAAEFAKLAETTYRNVNIGLANEFARYAEQIDVDVFAVIEASNSQPFSHIHSPGISVGGHCIPVYPKFYLSTDQEATIPAAAISANESMPAHAVDRLEKALGGSLEGSTVAVLGAAYRGGVKETAFSGVFPLVAELEERGANPRVGDPLYTDDELKELGFEPHHLGTPCGGLIVATDHDEYRELDASQFPGCVAVVDGRGVLDPTAFGTVPILRLGRGQPGGGAVPRGLTTEV